MCLNVPGKIEKIEGTQAIVDYINEKRVAHLVEDDFMVGDYVIVTGGFVVSKVEQKEAKEALELYLEAVTKKENQNL